MDPTGRNNLAHDSENINQKINDDLNKMGNSTLNHNLEKESDNLVNWAKNNTKAGQYLSEQYSGGQRLGRATGTTVNEINRNNKKDK